MEHLGIKERLGVFAHKVRQRLHQILRLAAGRADEYPVAPVDMLKDVIQGRELILVGLLQFIKIWPSVF